MGRRSEHSRDELRGMILSAARRLVREQGEAALTARNIAKAIGYTPGMLYHIFPNQDAMVQALAEELLAELAVRLKRRLAEAAPAEAMLAISREYIALATEEAPLWRLIWNHPYRERERSHSHQSVVGEIFTLGEQALRHRHPEWNAARLQTALQAWLAGLQGIAMLGITERLQLLPGVTVDAVAEALTQQFAE